MEDDKLGDLSPSSTSDIKFSRQGHASVDTALSAATAVEVATTPYLAKDEIAAEVRSDLPSVSCAPFTEVMEDDELGDLSPSSTSDIKFSRRGHVSVDTALSAETAVEVATMPYLAKDEITVEAPLDEASKVTKPLGARLKDGRLSASSSTSSLEDFKIDAEKGALLDLERGVAGPAPSLGARLLFRIRQWVDGHFILTKKCPEIVLPKAPSDKDKYGYIQTRRPIFLLLGLFAFLSSSAGLWLFALCSNVFIWYAPVVLVLQVHIFLSYGLGACAKDFDLKKHNELLQEFPVASNNASVDIYLPVCKEPLIILRNTWNHVKKVQWAHGTLTVHVLDDGAMDDVKAMADEFGFNYIRRDDRPFFRKAGNLRYAFARTSGDFFTIFDADFCPRHDFLDELMPRMQHDPKIAIIQTPQFFRTTKENTWIERGCSEVQELFYRWSQVNRDRWNASICVGSNALYRREALADVGGTALVGASEDVHTGFYAITRGWSLRYIPICLAAGISPDTPRAAFSQQIRWSQGSTSLLLNGDFHKARLGFMTKVCFLSGMLYYWTTSISCFTIPLPGLLLVWCRPEVIRFYNLSFAAPSLIYSILVYRIWSVGAHSIATEQIRVLQAYAYLFGIKDRIMGKTHEWVSSGASSKAHKKSNLYAKARSFAIFWTIAYQTAWLSGLSYRLIRGELLWWEPFPQILLYAFDLYVSLPFLLTPAY